MIHMTEEERMNPECRMSDSMFGIFEISGIGKCRIKVKQYEDDELPPKAYLVKAEDLSEICTIMLKESRIVPDDALNIVQKMELTKYMATSIKYGFMPIGIEPFRGICSIWEGNNNYSEDRIIPIDEPLPDYTK